MREIKFRVWDKERKWFLNDDMFIELDGTLWDDSDFKYNTPNKEIERVKTDRYVIEQYTGLKDKNGKEIYEGDVVLWIDSDGNERIDYVWFSDGAFRICNSKYTFSDYLVNCLQAIGNIHENPELLEVRP